MLDLKIDTSIINPITPAGVYDVAIVGSGPAGMTAAIYSSRALLTTLVLEKLGAGGQAAVTDHIENFPGFPEGINGFELSQKMQQQAEKFGTHFESAEVKKVIKDPVSGIFTIEADGASFQAKTVIIATGTKSRKLGVKGEEEFIGRGISFCATCDGAFYRDKTVAVIGGGDSAVDEGLFLTRFVKKVYLIHRREKLRAEKILQKRAIENPKIEIRWNTIVQEVIGDTKIRKIRINDVKACAEKELEIDGMFLYIGLEPITGMVDARKDVQGYIITDEAMRTNIPGLFAAGDCRLSPLRQVSTAVGDGAVAAHYAEKFIEEGV